MTRIIYKPGFIKLSNYLNSQYAIEVVLRPFEDDAYYPKLQKIYINSNNQWKDRLITLIHEAGHVLREFESDEEKKLRPSLVHYTSNVKSKRQLVCLLDEEICAWNKGKKLAVKLKIRFDERRLDIVSTECIMSYIKTSLQKVYGSTINIDCIDAK